MKLRTRIAAAAAAAALVSGAGLAVAPSASATSNKTILSVVSSVDRFTSTEKDGLDRFRWDQRNWYDFDILTAAVVADNGTLLGAVQDPTTAVTLFAPNDRAFQLLAKDLTGKWLWTEQAVLNAIVGAVTAGNVNLRNVLTYHVVGDKFLKADVVPLIGSPIPTLNGGTITVQAPNRFGFIEIKDEVDSFRNPYLITTDIDAGNSVIHSISRVLVPANV